jgi:hypothetical protein
MPDEVTEGRWKIFVVAEQGSIRKSKVFEEELTFKPLGTGFPIQFLIVILAIIGLVLGWRLIRSSSSPISKSQSRFRKSQLGDKQIAQELIKQLNAQIAAQEFRKKKRPTKKRSPKKVIKKASASKESQVKKASASKKSQVKKASASKKSQVKKASASKKSQVKKATLKKKSVRKKPAKRATAKKR